jgi:hypothetical protein
MSEKSEQLKARTEKFAIAVVKFCDTMPNIAGRWHVGWGELSRCVRNQNSLSSASSSTCVHLQYLIENRAFKCAQTARGAQEEAVIYQSANLPIPITDCVCEVAQS